MTMQTREPSELLSGDKENAKAATNVRSSVVHTKCRSNSDALRRVYGSDRFKLVQSRRGSDVAIPDRLPACTDVVNVERGTEVPSKNVQKKEPPVVPDRILETHLDAHGFVKTRSYLKGKFLGKGGFARCYELKCETTGKVYAGKVVAKSSLLKPHAKQKFTSEIKIHKTLEHPQIVQFEHFFDDTENAYILLELCRNQSLSDLMRKRKRLSETEVRFYIRQLVDGLVYLHQNLVIHRDLKLGNLFLTSKMQLKIGDFGLATRLETPDDRKRTMCGTPNYIAPEILNGKHGDGHSFEVDIWSTGVVMYTLLVGRPPFESDDVKATYKLIRANRFDFPETAHVSSAAQSLIRSILRSDPGARPSLEQILKHPFLADEFVPATLPRTALFVTPPSYKDQLPTNSSESQRAAMKGSQSGSDRASTSLVMQSQPPVLERDGSGRGSSSQQHLATTVMGKQESRELPSQNVLEAAYKSLARLFYLKENTQESNSRITASSSAASIVAEAQMIKQIRDDSNEIEPLVPASLWISQWVDYTSKYGIGYLLSNGEAGVYFNDSTKMIATADGRVFEYFERQSNQKLGLEPRVRYSMKNYDPALQKKVTLLGHFKGYLVDARAENDEADVLESQLFQSVALLSAAQSMVFVKKWVKTRHAVLFQLSNSTIQLNFFDKSKLMLGANARVVTYLNRDGDMSVFSPSTAILSANQPDLSKRLRYAKDMLQQMVRAMEQ